MSDSEWLCRREYATVPDGARLEIGSYKLHRASKRDVHRIVDGWSVRLDSAGEPLVAGGEPEFDEVDLEATEAE